MKANKKIATIGYQIPGNSNLLLDFRSKKSLMDYDIVLFSPNLPYYQLSSAESGYYRGLPCYGDSGSFELLEDMEHWKKELINALQAGKTVYFLMTNLENFYIDSGSRSSTGTGKNRVVSISVSPYNNYELLPIKIGKLVTGSGSKILPTKYFLFNEFFEKFKAHMEYKVYIENPPQSEIIFTGSDTTKILGLNVNYGAGNFVALPYIEYDFDKFTETEKSKNSKGSADRDDENNKVWTKSAIKFGSDMLDLLISIDDALKKDSKQSSKPLWANNEKYRVEKELTILNEMKNNDNSIRDLTDKNIQLESELQEAGRIDKLLYEQGKPLEDAISLALEVLGFSTENYNDGNLEIDHVINSPEGIRCIGEAEGKDSKDINIDKMRQLLDSLTEDSLRDDVDEKAIGILFGNAQRLVDPSSRTMDFTEKCKKTAKRENIALVRTVDLYFVVKHLLHNQDKNYQESCRKAIFDQVGGIVKFPKYKYN